MIDVTNQVISKLKDDLLTNYSGLKITSTSGNTPTTFPTLNVQSLGNPTTAEDLEMDRENAIISTIQLKAYEEDLLSANDLMVDASDSMLSMHYKRIYGVETISDVTPFCVVARFRRTVGNGDSLY